MGAFEDIVKGATQEDLAILGKYNLKTTLDEYDGLKVKFTDADQRLRSWETWKADNWDPTAKTTKTEMQLRQLYQESQDRNAALEAASGADMTFEEILGHLQQKGYTTKADVESVVVEKTKDFAKADDIKKSSTNLSAGFEHVYTKTFNLGNRHMKEFGEELNIGDVFKYMGDNQVNDPEVAYAQMVTGKRQELQAKRSTEMEAKHKQELEDAKKAGEVEGAKKAVMGSGGKLPTDQGGNPMGHMERKSVDRAKASLKTDEAAVAEVPKGVKLGDNVLSTLGYQELVKQREAASA